MNESGTPEIPSVPGFELRRLLGRGSQAEVWLALDLARTEQVALKLRPGATTPTPSRADREVTALRRIDHPHVVRLHRVVAVSGGGAALVLEHAPGGSLRDLMARRSHLDPPEVSGLLVPLARGLAHLHERGLVHGDLAPGNVLFADDGRPLLADLGASRMLGVDPDHGLGTTGFVDPALTGPADPAADVRALAALGWYALTGLVPAGPWQGLPEDLAARLQQCWAELPARRAEDHPFDPSALIGVLARCLQDDRDARPSATDLVREAWAAVTPAPIRLLAWGLGPDGEEQPAAPGAGPADVTRRLRAAAAVPVAVPAPGRRVGRPAVAATLLAVTTVGAAVGGWQLAGAGLPSGRHPDDRPLAASGAPSAAPSAAAPSRAASAAARPAGQPAGPGQERTARPSPDPAARSGDLTGIPSVREAEQLLRRLSDGRAAALQAGTAEALAAVDEPGSPAFAADAALLRRLQDRGLRLDGLTFRLSGIRVVSRGPQAVALTLAVAASPHRRVPLAADGPAEAVAAGSPRQVTVTLVRLAPGERGWRVRAVSPVSGR